MTETDTRVNIIDPKLYQSGWWNGNLKSNRVVDVEL
jgi:type I site-specific restriction endonuclease